MRFSFFETPAIALLNRGLDGAALRHEVIAGNIANVNTPGYKRKDVVFETMFQEALASQSQEVQLKTTHPRHISDSARENGLQVIRMPNTSFRIDGNNVDIDREMANLAKNTLWYNAMSQQLAKQLQVFRYVINDGRR